MLVRVKLAGNFIWGPQRTPKLHLDGDVFGIPADGRVDIGLPSGNGRFGGDLDMWFWLFRPSRIGGVGFFPGRASRFFAVASGATSLGRQALQLGIDRSSADLRGMLPAGYQVDASQRFSANDAVAIARRTGVTRLVGLVSDRHERLGRFLSEQLQATLQVTVATEVVPDAQLQGRVRAMMANQAGPDLVMGDEALAERLQQIQYHTEFIRL